jgi:mannitol/fructose-specific phosphotransferase system IIA component (Ntr-type)
MLIAMTTSPAVNTVSAQRARELFGVPAVFALPDRYAAGDRADSASRMEGDEPVPLFPRDIDAAMWNRWVFQGEVERGVVPIVEAGPAAEILPRFGDEETTLPLLVVRDGRKHVTGAVEELAVDDQVVILRRLRAAPDREDPFAALVRTAPVLDLSGAATVTETFAAVSRILSDRMRISAARIQELLTQREESSSTVLFPGVAIPHIFVEGSHQSVLVLIRAREGVTFFGEDDAVRILFVIAGTNDERNLHLRILSSIAQLLQDASFEERWMEAEGEEDLRAVVLSTERRRF